MLAHFVIEFCETKKNLLHAEIHFSVNKNMNSIWDKGGLLISMKMDLRVLADSKSGAMFVSAK